MNENYTNSDLLVQYLDGELKGEDLDAMKQKIATDRQLAAELESLTMTKAAVQTYGVQQRIAAVHKEMMQELDTAAAPPRIGMRRILQYSTRIAALFILVLGITAGYQYFSASPEKLFRDGYETFSLRETRSTENSSPLEVPYKRGDFAAAGAAFRQLTAPQAADYFLNGNAALAMNNAPEAIRSFLAVQEKNKKDNAHSFEDDTDYYLALAYLRNNEPAKAKPLFEQIHADPGHPYHSKITGWWLRRLQHIAK